MLEAFEPLLNSPSASRTHLTANWTPVKRGAGLERLETHAPGCLARDAGSPSAPGELC